MQRKELKALLSSQGSERNKLISGYTKEFIEHYIHLVNEEIFTNKNTPSHSLFELLEDLTIQRNKYEQQSKDEMMHLIFSLYETFKQQSPVEGEMNHSLFKTVDVFKERLTENKKLKNLLAERNEMIQIQKEQMKAMREEYKQEEILNNKLKHYFIEISSEYISRIELIKIINKYDKKNYGFFSHAPGVIHALKMLCQKSEKMLFSRFEVQTCFEDSKKLFVNTPRVRRNLSQREHLICELADAFKDKKEFLQEIKFR